MTDDLNPCPFCGVVPTEIERDSGRYRTIVYHTPHCPALDPGYRTKTAALAAWNTRPAEDALRTRIAELEAQCASVPWEALWRIYNGQADDDAWIDYGDWLLAYAPGDESL